MRVSVVGQPGVRDGRARFREIFCAVLESASPPQTATCDQLLVRLQDEPAPHSAGSSLPALNPRLRILFVPGAFQGCFQQVATPYDAAMRTLNERGVQTSLVPVSVRSSGQHNAAQIADAVRRETLAADEHLVLVGYSKGASDILEFLIAYPVLAQRIRAVVSISGTVNGTPLADEMASIYALASGLPLPACAPGDGGVLTSISRGERMRWLARNRLPAHIRYFSLGSFAPDRDTARLMNLTKSKLDRVEPLNDGQTIFYDQLIPGSTLLGYANGDHWAIVLPLQDKWRYWAGNPAGTIYPRDPLFEAIVLYLSEALQ